MFNNSAQPVHRIICAAVFTLLLMALSPAWSAGGDEYSEEDEIFGEIYSAMKDEQWSAAIGLLNPMAADEPDNADVQNLLGYAHRKLERFDEALTYYTRALEIDPRHRGALEYSGQLFLDTNQLEKAEARLERLSDACLFTCKEKRSLKRAIKKYRATTN